MNDQQFYFKVYETFRDLQQQAYIEAANAEDKKKESLYRLIIELIQRAIIFETTEPPDYKSVWNAIIHRLDENAKEGAPMSKIYAEWLTLAQKVEEKVAKDV